MSSPEMPSSSASALLSQELNRQSTLAVLLSQSIAEQLGLSPSDLECLEILSTQALTAGQLAEKARLTAGAITGVIDRLERAGYVQRRRDQQDRRRVIVQPCTEKIERDIAPFFASFESTLQGLYARYNEQELLLIADFLKRLNALGEQAISMVRQRKPANEI